MTAPQQQPEGYGYGPPPPPYGQAQWTSGAEPPTLQAPTYPPYAPSGWPVPPQTDGTAICVLVLAISSFVVFPVVPAVVALVLAPGAERDIAASGGRLTGDSLVRAGRVVAWIHLGLCLAGLLLLLAVFGLFGAVAFSD